MRGQSLRGAGLGLAAALLVSCGRNLQLPGPPGPGTLYGRVVYSQPGQPQKQPAVGATVELLGGAVAVTAGADGRFLLSPVESSSGQVLVRFDPAGSGRASNQLLIDLAAVGAGPGRQIGLGDVTVSENAQLHGKVLRGDIGTASGHGGTVVYVPQGPYTTYTGDDGSFQLHDLPAGTLSVALFRVGYRTVSIDDITLRAGEDFAVRDQSLQPDAGATSAPGSISGHVTFSPAASAAGASVVAVDGATKSITGTFTAAGDFTVASVPGGLYQLTVSQAGYLPGRVANLLVSPGQNAAVADVLLVAAPTSGGGGTCIEGSYCQPAVPGACTSGRVHCNGTSASCVQFNLLDGSACVDPTCQASACVCQSGACVPYCAGVGVACNAGCDLGQVNCGATGPSCLDLQVPLPNGTPCGIPGANTVCTNGACGPCTPGVSCSCTSACVPANPCHQGTQACGSTSGCTELATTLPNGTPCPNGQPNMVCSGGTCLACTAGLPCQPLDPCKTGGTSCVTGALTCVESGPVADTPPKPCGGANVCRGGSCVSPTAQVISTLVRPAVPPLPTDPNSPTGVAVGSDGTVYFSDSSHHQVKKISPSGGVSVVAGTGLCGFAGDGGPADQATLCSPKGLALDESANPPILYIADYNYDFVRAVVLALPPFNVIARVAGGGTAPAPGYGDGGPATGALLASPSQLTLARDFQNPAIQYLYVADSGHNRIRRIDTASGVITAFLSQDPNCNDAVDFFSCGGEFGCSVTIDGQGNAFVSGQFCGDDFVSYTYGVVRIPPGGGKVQVAGLYNGSASEGINARTATFAAAPALALDAAGNLYAADSSANKVRRIEGTTGRITTVVGTGASTSTGDGGDPRQATVYAPYALAFDPVGRLDLFLTEHSGNAVRRVQALGTSVSTPAALSANSPLQQQVLVDQKAPLPHSVKLVDGAGAALVGYPVRFASLSPPGTAYTPVVVTNLQGIASTASRVGLSGPTPPATSVTWGFEASYQDIHGRQVSGSPVRFDVLASPPAPGTLFNAVNDEGTHGAGSSGAGGPGTQALISAPRGVQVASDGTVYFADSNNHVVKALATDGTLTVVAGTATVCGFADDTGPAVQATLCGPRGLALDESGPDPILYIGDYNYGRVRRVNLRTGIIDLVAGSGQAAAEPYGDGGPATAATLASVTHVRLRGQKLYVADSGHNRIRVVDLSQPVPTISGWLSGLSPNCAARVAFNSCGGETGCDVAWDPAGTAYVSGQFCGTDYGSYSQGIASFDGVNLAQVAGRYNGGTSDGIPAIQALLNSPPTLDLHPSGILLLAVPADDKIRYLDLSSGRIYTYAGTGVAGYAGDYVPLPSATNAKLNSPWEMAVSTSGRGAIADTSNNAVRVLW